MWILGCNIGVLFTLIPQKTGEKADLRANNNLVHDRFVTPMASSRIPWPLYYPWYFHLSASHLTRRLLHLV
jgi:hypothetical protein